MKTLKRLITKLQSFSLISPREKMVYRGFAVPEKSHQIYRGPVAGSAKEER